MALSKNVRIKFEVNSRTAQRGLQAVQRGNEGVADSAKRAGSEQERFLKRTSALQEGFARSELKRIDAAAQARRRLIEQQGANISAYQEESSSIGGLELSLDGLISRFAGPAGLAAAGVAVVGSFVALNEAADQLATRSLEVSNVFQNVPFSIEPARRATQGLVTDFDLARLASDAVSLGVTENARGFSELAEAFTKLGARRGEDALKSIESGFTAIGRASPLLLDNLGITLQISEAQNEYAQQLGKSSAALSEQERAEAFRVVASQRVIEAARSITTTTDGAAAAVRRFNVELQNVEDRALGGDVGGTLSIAEGLTQLADAGERLDASEIRRYGSEFLELRSALRDSGVASADLADVTANDLAKSIEQVNLQLRIRAKEEELARRASERDPAARQARLRAEADAQALEAARARIPEIQNELAFLSANNKAVAQKAELQIENLKLQALIVRATGDEAKAREIERQAELAQLRELSRIANQDAGRRRRGGGGRRDPFREQREAFNQLLLEANNAERAANFATLNLRSAQTDLARFRAELQASQGPGDLRAQAAREQAELQAELDQDAFDRRLALAEAQATNDAQRDAIAEERSLREQQRLTEQIALETDVAERKRLISERENLRTQDEIRNIEARARAEEEAAQRRTAAINTVQNLQSQTVSFGRFVASETIKGERNKQKALNVIAAGEAFTQGALDQVKAISAFASGNIPQGIALQASAAFAFAQGGIIAAGRAGSGRGGGPSTGGGSEFSAGERPQSANFTVDRGAPLSVRDEIEGNPNNTGPTTREQRQGGVVINGPIQVLGAIDDQAAARIAKGIRGAGVTPRERRTD